MKHFILTLLSILALSTLCLAQKKENTLQIGVLGGPTHTKTRSKVPLDVKSDYRTAAGLSAQYSFGKYYLKSDLLYENKGYRITYQISPKQNQDPSVIDRSNESEYTVTFNHYYLTIPVLIGIPVKETGFFINAGPYIGILLKQNLEERKLGKQTLNGGKKTDFGATAGLGYQLPIFEVIKVSVEVRHNLGLQNISTGPLSNRTNSTSLLFGIHYIINN